MAKSETLNLKVKDLKKSSNFSSPKKGQYGNPDHKFKGVMLRMQNSVYASHNYFLFVALHCKIATKSLHCIGLYSNTNFLISFPPFKKLFDVQAIFSVVVIEPSPLYFRFSN